MRMELLYRCNPHTYVLILYAHVSEENFHIFVNGVAKTRNTQVFSDEDLAFGYARNTQQFVTVQHRAERRYFGKDTKHARA